VRFAGQVVPAFQDAEHAPERAHGRLGGSANVADAASRRSVLACEYRKQEIVGFRKVMRPQRSVLHDLERTKQRYIAEDLDIYFDDIVDAAERIWDMLENFKEIVEALESTNEQLISHKVNDVLRVLTAFSVAILPLTLIASIWGMNVRVPGEQNLTAFWIIVSTMVVLLAAMLTFFRRRGFL